jgi:hypothetical protein
VSRTTPSRRRSTPSGTINTTPIVRRGRPLISDTVNFRDNPADVDFYQFQPGG